MSKDPAILFYTSDFLSGTFTMTDEQIGRYIKLLCLQHQKGYLTEKDMLNICKTYDEDIYTKFINEDGKYYNKRMKSEIEKRVKYSESRRNNRKTKETSEKDMNNISNTYDEHMENENINENIIINIIERENKFKEKVFEFSETYTKELLDKFFNHWSQHGEKDKKMLFEKQKSFEIKKRLITWFNNSKEYERKNRFNNKADTKGNYNAGKEKDYSTKL